MKGPPKVLTKDTQHKALRGGPAELICESFAIPPPSKVCTELQWDLHERTTQSAHIGYAALGSTRRASRVTLRILCYSTTI
jgi:hypothetical protein